MTEAGIFLTGALAIGLGATAFMDVVAMAQKRLLGVPSLNYAMVGRWIGHLPRGQLVHPSIGAAPAIRHEAALGWAAHYAIGVGFAAILLGVTGIEWLQSPTLLPGLLFGIVSVIALFVILQPGMGAGLAASRTPQPWTARRRSLVAHVSFGLGLYLSALVWSAII